MDLKELDAILGSAEKGPVTETFSKKGNIVYASYKSALEIRRIYFTRLSLSILMSPIFPLYTMNLY
jgi:hypothetical protein